MPTADLDAPLLSPRAVPRVLARRDRQEATDFEVLAHDPGRHDPARDLVLLIHPGDLIEMEGNWNSEGWEEVGPFNDQVLDGTAGELRAWRGADIAILHRGSCSQFEPDCHGRLASLYDEIEDGWRRGTLLYGDDLDAAAAWMLKHLHIAARPRILLAGAYSTPGCGCLTHIGKQVEKVADEHRIVVSDWSPPGNSPEEVWRPGGRSVPFWEAQGDRWRTRSSARGIRR